VLGTQTAGVPVRFRVYIDGARPGRGHGLDVNEQGEGTVTDERLYQLIRQNGQIADRTFEITFLDPGAQAYVFTFG
jgi:Thioredoxin like C-terminal domain